MITKQNNTVPVAPLRHFKLKPQVCYRSLMFFIYTAGALSLMLLTSGCSITPELDKTQSVPERDEVPSNFRITSQSLYEPNDTQAYSDATFDLEAPLTLQKAIEISLANNPSLMVDHYEIQASWDEKDEATGAVLPSIGLQGGYSRYRDYRLIQPRRPGTAGDLQFSDELFSGDIVLSIPVYTGGKLVNQIKSAELIAQSKERQLLHNRSELVFNVSSVFYSILSQREVIESLNFSHKVLEEHLKKIRDLIEAQKAAKVDLLRTEVRLADIEQQLIHEQNILKIKKSVLANYLGLEGSYENLDVEGELQQTETPSGSEDGFARAMINRQDYQSLLLTVEASEKTVEIAKARRSVDVSLRASYGNRWDGDSSQDNEVGEIGLYAQMPLFEGGRIEAAIRRVKNRLNAQKQMLRKLQQQIRLEIDTAKSNLQSTQARIDVTQKALEQSQESLRIERQKYELGKGAIVDVLDAQSEMLNSQVNYYTSLADYNIAAAQLRMAIGEIQ
jgi:outer membrane protein